MDKKEVARIFEEIAILLELKAENPFKIRAYQNAARSLLNMDKDLQDAVKEETLTDIPGIGKDLAQKIVLLATTGHLPYYEELKQKTPPGLLALMQVHGLGGKKIKILYDKLGIDSIAALKEACLKELISALPGFGPKSEKNILDAIAHMESYGKRHLWWDAMAIASPILEGLRKLKGVRKADICRFPQAQARNHRRYRLGRRLFKSRCPLCNGSPISPSWERSLPRATPRRAFS